eukprot:7894016-Ditylum_brightwellii.AAC.1
MSVGTNLVYPGNTSQGNDVEEGNENGDDTVDNSITIVEASLVKEGVYDAQPIHLTHVPISSTQHVNEGRRNVFKKNKSLSWGLLFSGIIAIAVG